MYNFFISHFSGDKEIANVIANTLKRITLNLINPWFSSDSAGKGGITPGSVWLDSIREKLSTSKAVVVLLTPNSISKPWLYFESGIGESKENCEIIPICIGFNGLSEIPFPLAMYQCFPLTDYNSLKRFVHKLLEKYEITFDEEMTRPILEQTIRELNKFSFADKDVQDDKEDDTNSHLLEEIKKHFDIKFLGLADRFEDFFNPVNEGGELYSSYSYEIKTEFSKKKIAVEIYHDSSALEVMNSIYFKLESILRPYHYLKTWILEDEKSGVKLDMLEFLAIIPANEVFNPRYEWKIKKLDKHHNQLDSYSKLDSWFNKGLIR